MRRIYRWMWSGVLLTVLGLGWPAVTSAQESGLRAPQEQERVAKSVVAAVPPVDRAERLYPQDPADSLYRAARERLNRDDYRRAADMFRELRQRYPRSSYAAQALYYQAFSLYRIGAESDLRAALDALRDLQANYSSAQVARADAEALAARINGALARSGDARAAEDVARAAAGVRGDQEPACRGEDNEIRIAALNALLQMSSERALPILEKVLANRSEDECSVAMRRKAVFLLSQHVREDNVDLLLDLVRNDPDHDVRAQAVFWLSQVPGERTVQALEEILRSRRDPEIQGKALFALSQHRSERADRVLRDLALRDDVPRELRRQAIFWLGQRGGDSKFLRDLYSRTEDLELKERVLFSLAQQSDPENAAWLLGIAGDSREPLEMRKKAIFWASQMGRIPAVQIAALYDQIPEREFKEQVIFALAHSSDDAAIEKLLDIAENDKDVELRKKAIFWLSQSSDPRVQEFLLRVIEGK